jgi:hypothetical protein
MKRTFAITALCLSVFAIMFNLQPVSATEGAPATEASSVAIAGSAELLETMKKARASLVALLDTSDQGTQTVLIKEIHAATAEADAKLDAMLADASLAEDAKTKLADVKATWEEFKKTREEEIIPAIQAGEVEKAKGIATGVQKERFKKIISLLE